MLKAKSTHNLKIMPTSVFVMGGYYMFLFKALEHYRRYCGQPNIFCRGPGRSPGLSAKGWEAEGGTGLPVGAGCEEDRKLFERFVAPALATKQCTFDKHPCSTFNSASKTTPGASKNAPGWSKWLPKALKAPREPPKWFHRDLDKLALNNFTKTPPRARFVPLCIKEVF